MKRIMNVLIRNCILLLVIPILFNACQKKQEYVSAEVKFSNGTQKTIESFRREIISHAMYSKIRTDVEQITYTERDNLWVEVGPYEIEIPFKS
ncbi:MAG: hypothetical protein HC906_15385 [Bacteroidales bacterium]|nr:hypothetical protein [Bacteroidales bacterium]